MTTKLALTSGGGGTLFVEDVFATFLYAGTSVAGAGPGQNIVNGINLAAYGGMVWTKVRNSTQGHLFIDTLRGPNVAVSTSNSLQGGNTTYTSSVTSFNANGYTLGNDSSAAFNAAGGSNYVSWTFRRRGKFFDVVTYTGTGVARTVAHQLGAEPGFILVKRTDTSGTALAYHRSAGATNFFNISGQQPVNASSQFWNNTAPTTSVFTVGIDANVNASGGTYVAYLFAHDAATDGIIQCGSWVGNGSASGPTVTLGWEPQCLIVKASGAGGGSQSMLTITDNLRGMSLTDNQYQQADGAVADAVLGGQISLRSNGFQVIGTSAQFNTSGATYYYVAIRRPQRPPTIGTSVFMPEIHASPGTSGNSNVTFGFPPDLFLTGLRDSSSFNKLFAIDRMRGGQGAINGLATSASQGETSAGVSVLFDRQTSINITDTGGGANGDFAGRQVLTYGLRRAPRFFDVVLYTGTGVAKTESHALEVAPELMIVKARGGNEGVVYAAPLGATQALALFSGTGSVAATTSSLPWANTAPTPTVFTVGTGGSTNAGAGNYVAYLFASRPGVSRVGSYTGNGGTAGSAGTSQTINCGFSTGARFVLIKRTDSAGDWYIWDTIRGIVAGNDPRLSLNSTASEVTTDDSLDPDNTGFIVNQLAATNINVTGATYIYLAIA